MKNLKKDFFFILGIDNINIEIAILCLTMFIDIKYTFVAKNNNTLNGGFSDSENIHLNDNPQNISEVIIKTPE